MTNSYVCCFCHGEGAELRWDKRGSPYVRCVSCGTRAFLPTSHALRGFIVTQGLLRGYLEERMVNPAAARDGNRLGDEFIAQLRAARVAAMEISSSDLQQSEPEPQRKTA